VSAGQRVLVRGIRRAGSAARLAVRLQLVDVAPPRSDGTPQLLSVSYRSNTDLERIEQSGLDLTHDIHAGVAEVISTGAKQLAALKRLGLPYKVRIADLNAYDARSRAADARYTRSVARSPLPSGRTAYRVLHDYQDELKALVKDHPGLVRPVVLPKRTYQGREIMGVEIAKDVGASDGRPVYFAMGMHHAREWPSAEAVLEFAHLLAQGYGSDARITRLLESERVVIVPIVNVDGFVESREGGAAGLPDGADTTGAGDLQTVEGVALLGGSFAYRRKNCAGAIPSPDVPCTLQWGIDNNRNYGNGWGGPGAGTDPITQSYRGPAPFSEPETQAVWEYSRTRAVTGLVTMHNVAALVLRPPGLHNAGKAPDEPRMKQLGDAMAAATGYTSQYSYQLYDTSGTTDDYTYAAQGGYAYTIEMGPQGGEFHMPYKTGVVDQWDGTYAKNGLGLREALLLGAESAADPMDHSVLTGSAAPGTVLRLKKTFGTQTGPICSYAQGYINSSAIGGSPVDCVGAQDGTAVPDRVDLTTVVPVSGSFRWDVNPSTRPFVGEKFVEQLEPLGPAQTFKPKGDEHPTPRIGRQEVESVAGGDTEAASSVEREFELTPADAVETDQLKVRLEWGTPEDYDLRLYHVKPDGTREPIGIGTGSTTGQSASNPGTPEQVLVNDPPPGRYIARVVYYAAPGNDWTLSVTPQRQIAMAERTGKAEAYTLTCEAADGSVLGSRDVTVWRGEALALALPAGCGGSGPATDAPATVAPAGGAGSASRRVAPPLREGARVKARAVRVGVAPRRDRSAPYRFRVMGAVIPAAGQTRVAACGGGTVTVLMRRGSRAVVRRALALDRSCRFSTVLTARRRGTFAVSVRFAGSRTLLARTARAVVVRAG
jgi:hypothetical protein